LNILVFGIGNPGRGDDALGPLLVDAMQALRIPGVEMLVDFQLQIEHVLDLHGRDSVVFVDAALNMLTPFEFVPAQATVSHAYTSHALAPGALLAAYESHWGAPHPPAHILAVRGRHFDLGAALSVEATAAMAEAGVFLEAYLRGQA